MKPAVEVPLMLGIIALVAYSCQNDAHAHEWYPSACCHEIHCFKVPSDQVETTPEGYHIKPTDEIIPYNELIFPWRDPNTGGNFSPDGDYHMCTYSGKLDQRVRNAQGAVAGKIRNGRCFWVPGPGF